MMIADIDMRKNIRIPLSDPGFWKDIKRGVIPPDLAERVLQGYQYTPGLISLIEDLRMHLQNTCFSKITKERVEPGELDPNYPHLELNKSKKMLEIIPAAGKSTWPVI